MLNAEIGVGCGPASAGCGGAGDCPAPPDLCIKRHDTRPPLKISMADCDGPVDLTEDGLVLEASMWFDAKLKSELDPSDTELRFADDIGFQSVSVGDVVSTPQSRSPEMMLVTAVDEAERKVVVARGHEGTTPQSWPKGSPLSVFRFRGLAGSIESVFEEAESLDGTVSETLADTLLVFDWSAPQTSLPGCYWLEFKIVKLVPGPGGDEVGWVKRVPLSAPGFMVRIVDSPTSPD